MTPEFRTLTPGDVKVRIGGFTDKGVELLVFKNARVDANILDDTVGPMNWKCEPSEDLKACTISIWDDEKKEWIAKGDAGDVRMFATCPNKEIASDAFKRAATKWGIGRELYNLPKILVLCETKRTNRGYVSAIQDDPLLFGLYVDEMKFSTNKKNAGSCTRLVIKNGYGDTLFDYDSKKGVVSAEKPTRELSENELPKLEDIPAIDFDDGEYVDLDGVVYEETPLDALPMAPKTDTSQNVADPRVDLASFVRAKGGAE